MNPAPGQDRRLICRRRGGRAVIDGVETIMLGASDYLGLSFDPRVLEATGEALRTYGTGTGIYPVFATTPLHEALCNGLAAFLGTETAMIYSSGSAANAGVLTTLVEAGDVIVSDRLNHASIIDGCRLSRASVRTYVNRDVADLRRVLEGIAGTKRRLIVTDGIFSMEGGAAPLLAIYKLAREFGTLLVVDEAHATGIVGPNGTGTGPLHGIINGMPDLLLTGSFSKALGGASGGFVAGPRQMLDRLKEASRGWTFTMGMTTANTATALAAIEIVRNDVRPLKALWSNLLRLRTVLTAHGMDFYDSDSAITALRVGDEDRARNLSARLRARGVFAPPVVFPIVARDEARLRLQVSASHTPDDIEEAGIIIAQSANET